MPLSYFIVQLKQEENLSRQLDSICVRHEANPPDAIRNARKKAVIKADNQIKGIVDRYSEVNQPLRNRLQFLRRVQIHLAKNYIVVAEEEEPIVVVDLIVEELDGDISMQE
uniref:Uncharacterized protein n=1 Tax=Ditylenchus dipsaci TaxID=166011 RepID=A0A915CV21_9BILA